MGDVLKYDFEEVFLLSAHPDSFLGWFFRIGHGKPELWNAVMTIWKYSF